MQVEIHNMAGHLIRRLNQISVSVFQDRMKSLGFDLTQVQFAALNAIRLNAGIDQASLAGLIAYDRATIGGVVDRLVAKGYVDRKVSETDRRAKVLALSEAGVALLGQVTPAIQALQTDILTGLDDAERDEFLRLAAKVAAAGNELSRAPLLPPKDRRK